MDRHDQDFDLTEVDRDLSLEEILAEYQSDAGSSFFRSAPEFSPAEEEDVDLGGFFRVSGEERPLEKPAAKPERVYTPAEPVPEADSFWERPAPRAETVSPASAPAEKKSSLPSEEEIRSFMAAFARGEYADPRQETPAPAPAEPEFDARFLMKEDYLQGPDGMMYGDNQTDISPEEDYEPPKSDGYVSAYGPDQFDLGEEADREEADPEPALLRKIRGKRSKKKKPAGKKTEKRGGTTAGSSTNRFEAQRKWLQSGEEEGGSGVQFSPKGGNGTARASSDDAREPLRPQSEIEKDEEFAASFRDYGATPADYADAGDYDTEREINEAAEFNRKEDFFPSSFKEYLFSIVTSLLYRFRGGGAAAATVQDEDEDLGPEVAPQAAMKYYGSFINSLRLRTRISVILLVFMGWLTLGLPVTGLLNNYKVAGLLCLAMQLAIMLLALDVVTNGILSTVRGKPGAETMAVLSCLLTSLDALLTGLTELPRAHMPLCLISSLSLVGLLAASLFSCRGLKKAIRVPAIAKTIYTVSGETGLKKGEVTLLKSLRPSKGFVRRAEEAAPDEELFRKLSVPMMLLALLFTLIIAIAKKNYTDLAFILSAVFCPAVPVTALLSFALPFFVGSVRIFSSGAGIAGWSGLCDIGQSKNLIVTDRDLFPDGSVELENVRIFAGGDPEKIIAYAGSMLTASGCCVSSCFAELMEKNGARLRKIENFEYLPGGGMRGVIDSRIILCGSSDLMQLMNVRVPFRLVNRTSVLLAVDGILYGIFNMKYTADPKVRKALVNLMRSNRHPVFAIRDFNVTPEMLRGCFDVATDGYDFPPYVERFQMSAAEPSEDSKVAAVVCREGLGPLTHLADTGRSMYVTVRLNLLLTVLCAVLGMLIVFIKLVGAGSVGAGFLFWYLVLWAVPVVIMSFILKA